MPLRAKIAQLLSLKSATGLSCLSIITSVCPASNGKQAIATNDGFRLTQSGTGCFIAVCCTHYGNSGGGVKGLKSVLVG